MGSSVCIAELEATVGTGRRLPLDYDELERRTRVGYPRGTRGTQGRSGGLESMGGASGWFFVAVRVCTRRLRCIDTGELGDRGRPSRDRHPASGPEIFGRGLLQVISVIDLRPCARPNHVLAGSGLGQC